MNLSELTEDQRTAATHKSGPLIVSAGAGSGKTFMLTQRIAYLFAHKDKDDNSFLNDIEQVCAITFTDKAAGEIKNKIRKVLQSEGLKDQALKVDSAWISTIHGMCSRILKTYALEVGVDPDFGVLSEDKKDDFLNEAFNQAIEELDGDFVDDSDQNNPEISQNEEEGKDSKLSRTKNDWESLFEECSVEIASADNATTIKSVVMELIGGSALMESGWEGFQHNKITCINFEAIAKSLMQKYIEVLALISDLTSKGAKKTTPQVEDSIKHLENYLKHLKDPHCVEEFASVIDKCVSVPCNFGSLKTVRPLLRQTQQLYNNIAALCQLAYVEPFYDLFIQLAKMTQYKYDKLKRSNNLLDYNDMLLITLHAFKHNPKIEHDFRNKFKIVMVDEFQDTSQLQISAIERMTGMPADSNSNFCTVGDAQQSIYRFQGADIQVYKDYKKKMISNKNSSTRYVEMDKNFRSHAAILKFVERIFGHRLMFGKEFLNLHPNENRESNFKENIPRVTMLVTKQTDGTSIEDARKSEARFIAKKFAEYREKGHRANEMVLLLGKMTQSSMYAQALRDQGFDCVISGGSAFTKTIEVKNILSLVWAIENQKNTEAVFSVLTGPMFNYSADEAMDFLSHKNFDTNKKIKEDYYFLEDAGKHAISKGLAYAVEEVVKKSGWLYRLEKQGTVGIAIAANVLKAQKAIQDIEEKCIGSLYMVALNVDRNLREDASGSPGSLVAEDADAVRIMTIHASKGLEFPIVAVAQYNGTQKTSGFLRETEGNSTEISLLPNQRFRTKYPNLSKKGSSVFKTDKEMSLEDVEEARMDLEKKLLESQDIESMVQTRVNLMDRIYHREIAEDMRKLYVGLTRAEEALILGTIVKIKKDGSLGIMTPVDSGILESLLGSEFADKLSTGRVALDYGGDEPGFFECVDVAEENAKLFEAENNQPKNSNNKEEVFENFEQDFTHYAREERLSEKFDDMVSYSSLHAEQDNKDSVKNPAVILERGTYEDENVEERIAQADVQDLDKATNLGSAFHRLAQYAVETGDFPTQEKYETISREFDLTDNQHTRLARALENWFNSDEFACTYNFKNRLAEVSFCVPYDVNRFLQGEIDLLCFNGMSIDGADVFVWDYKTGGSPTETMDHLKDKHKMQAECYAKALIYAGAKSVTFTFVRVERMKDSSKTAFVRFNFCKND